jgi:hypothetical protein
LLLASGAKAPVQSADWMYGLKKVPFFPTRLHSSFLHAFMLHSYAMG